METNTIPRAKELINEAFRLASHYFQLLTASVNPVPKVEAQQEQLAGVLGYEEIEEPARMEEKKS